EGFAFRRRPGAADADGGTTSQPQPVDQALDYFGKNFGLRTPEWASWSARMRAPRLAGKWVVTARRVGYGNYVGEMVVTAGSSDDEFTTRIKLQPVNGGAILERTGRVVVYAGYSWRGRSTGMASGSAPGEIPAEMYETMWISPDEPVATGRWFWGA